MPTQRILVTGGTGTLGRHVVPRLHEAGCAIRVFSRRPHDSTDGIEYVVGDLRKDQGIEAGVDGTIIILHLAGASKGDDVATRNLMRVASRAGTRHVVYISVIGANRMPVGYYRSKLAAEQAVVDSGVPWTILRAAQFDDALLKVVQQMTKVPVIPVPTGVRFQPVATSEVAARLVELALGSPAGAVPDLAGPRIYGMADLLRAYLRARGKHRLMLPLRLPGKAGRAFRSGANLAPDQAVGRRTWEDFLGERIPDTATNNRSSSHAG